MSSEPSSLPPFSSVATGELIQIYWHNKQPIFAVDFDPICNGIRFATGGADSNIRLWEISQLTNEIQFIATLSKHIRAVNCVKWSPPSIQNHHEWQDQSLLASAGDGGSLFIWHFVSNSIDPVDSSQSTCDLQDEQSISKEVWKVKVALETSNPFDIYALQWSPCSRYIATGTSDDSVRIYSVKESRCIKIIRDHSHFVNGISWDPLNQLIISISSDRSIKVSRLIGLNSTGNNAFRTQSISKISKANYSIDNSTDGKKINELNINTSPIVDSSNPPTNNSLNSQSSAELGFKLFSDEGLISFFRKGSFTPDGAYFYAPSGLSESGKNCIHVFIRNGFHLNHPSYSIVGFDKPPIGIFFFPKPLQRLVDGKSCFLYSVLTTDKVFIFESENFTGPLFVMQNYHLSTLTDASWQLDGRRLLVSSTDGFISMFNFDWTNLYKIKEQECERMEEQLTNEDIFSGNELTNAVNEEGSSNCITSGNTNENTISNQNAITSENTIANQITITNENTISNQAICPSNQNITFTTNIPKRKIIPTLIGHSDAQ